MTIVLVTDAILLGARYHAGQVLAVAPALVHLAQQLVAAGAAYEVDAAQAVAV